MRRVQGNSAGALPDVVSLLQRIARFVSKDGENGAKHVAVYDAFRKEIEAGRLSPGARLPADGVLAASLPASLATIQKALRRLADDGLLVRQHRKGTFVYDAPVAESEVRHLRFLADDGVTLLAAHVRVLSIDLVKNNREWSSRFVGEHKLIRIDRICNINYEFDVALETYLPARRFGNLRSISPRELDRTPLAHYLDKRLGAPTLRLERRFRVVELPERICASLSIKPGSMGLMWQTFAHSRNDELIMLQVAHAPPTARWLTV